VAIVGAGNQEKQKAADCKAKINRLAIQESSKEAGKAKED
jgi:hypothetical protein